MDFTELLSVADANKEVAKSEASVKRYSTTLAPPKKPPKSNVQSENVKRFLAKKKAEEKRLAEEAERRKLKLLELRAQNTKNNKKAKIMASRTKDNDFSKIKLTEDEMEAKRQREAELLKKNLANKVERMKARIALEEKEAMMPRKRKRKPKQTADALVADNEDEMDNKDTSILKRHPESENKKNHKSKMPQLSFNELLKVAETKQYEPIEIIPKKKEEPKLMTKKEKKIMQEEQERLRRKQELSSKGLDSSALLRNNSSSRSDKKISQQNIPSTKLNTSVTHVEKNNNVNSICQATKNKISSNNVDLRHKVQANDLNQKRTNKIIPTKITYKETFEQGKMCSKPIASLQNQSKSNIKAVSSKNEIKNPKILSYKEASKSTVPLQSINEDAIAAIEKRIREKIEKELAAKYGLNSQAAKLTNIENNKIINGLKKNLSLNSKNNGSTISLVKKPEKIKLLNNSNLQNKIIQKPLPEKKAPAFHPNPYLDPPRRLLEPQIKKPPIRKRPVEIEEEEEEDDDMSDFIDDRPSQNEDDYSKYIKEIFGYDRNRYQDEDDDDIVESSFAQQMQEEVISARAGYLEDLEEELKEREQLKKKKKLKLK